MYDVHIYRRFSRVEIGYKSGKTTTTTTRYLAALLGRRDDGTSRVRTRGHTRVVFRAPRETRPSRSNNNVCETSEEISEILWCGTIIGVSWPPRWFAYSRRKNAVRVSCTKHACTTSERARVFIFNRFLARADENIVTSSRSTRRGTAWHARFHAATTASVTAQKSPNTTNWHDRPDN